VADRKVYGTMRVYCERCGLKMADGFCLHGGVDETRARADRNGLTIDDEPAADRVIAQLGRRRRG
jgi:hypothetical protein